MSRLTHTYGPTCQLGPSVAFSGCCKGDDDIPPLKAHYFYSSPQPIDDPLSVVPIPSGADPKSASHPPRPYSAYDNKALEEAWVSVTSGKGKSHIFKRKSKSPSRKVVAAEQSAAAAVDSASKHTSEKKAKNVARLKQTDPVATVLSTTQTLPSSVHSKEYHDQSESAHAAKHRHLKADKSSAAIPTKSAHTRSSKTDGERASSLCPELDESEDNGGQEQLVKDNGDTVPPKKQSGRKERRTKSSQKDASTSDAQQSPGTANTTQSDAHPQGNPLNPAYDDPHHIPMDSDIAACCAEFERGKSDHVPYITSEETTNASGANQTAGTETSTAQKEDKSKGKQKLAIHEAQGDGAEEYDYESRVDNLDGAKGIEALKGKSKEAAQTLPSMHISQSAAENVPASDDAGLTGHPFLKMASRSPEHDATEDGEMQVAGEDEPSALSGNSKRHQRESTDTETIELPGCKAHKKSKLGAEVPVGVSRLHMVTLPSLQMTPIYWSPVHDIAKVTRGTWFYKDTMYPVEPAVANQLELGYCELRPWSQTWNDELTSAMEVGAAGEEKIAHNLWSKETEQQGKSRKDPEHTLYANPRCAIKCFDGEAAAEGSIDPEEPDKKHPEPKTVTKRYPSAQVIYKDAQNAFILKPALQPSAYYGRKPLAKIRKGVTVGVHVVRGFDWKLWDKLHPSKKSATMSKAERNAPVAGDADISKGTACDACKAQEERPKVTDLIMVIHGIGQKLSERMESFNFTHAINGFRRSINAELDNDAVHKTLRPELGGVMVLPINWRSNLSFEDGGPKKKGDKEETPDFTLKDITPDSIPAVRGIISDVMLDIPFYMSHHKPKMIRAAISEANRVYQLWCKNNPEFQDEGRVHLIAHSLGSAMALEILSKQPTVVSKVNPNAKKVNSKNLDFNTTNLFLCGSPAGFFLLLDKGRITPRKAQGKPGATGHDDVDKAIVGEAGTFGCLAVDNIYNIMHINDPIAYKLNAAVDPQYAASMKNAQVPSTTTGFFESIGNAMRSITPGIAGPQDLAIGQVQKPAAVTRLPSQLELEEHDFTREELAEKKFYLVNDCGQVDWFLSSGGGPLEIQYLNMLSAHSSYWGSPDFVRFIVIEVGRKPGRNNALPNMKVAKISRKEAGKKV